MVELYIDHDALLNATGGGHTDKKVAVDAVATADYLGSTSGGGVLRTDATLGYVDGGNFVTLSLSHLGIESLADPGADRILFWDDSATATAWLVPNTGLGITTTNLNVTADYSVISGNDGATDVTAAELEELTDGSATVLHSHAGGGGSEWTDAGTLLHPADLSGAEDVVVGGTTLANADIILGSTGAAIFNEQGADVDFRVEGDTEPNLFYVDAGASRVHIGGATAATADITLSSTTGANVFNNQGNAQDFRVESSGNAAMLFVDGADDRVGIGTALPSADFHVIGSNLQVRFEDLDNPGQVQYAFWTAGSRKGIFAVAANAGSFLADASAGDWVIRKDAGTDLTMGTKSTDDIKIIINDNKAMHLQSSGHFNWYDTGGTNIMRLMGDTGRLGLGDTSPDYPLEILNTSDPQFCISHTDTVDYFTMGVDADGNVDLDWSGPELAINEDGNDRNFRVEGSGAANALFVQGSDGFVGAGTGTPVEQLTVAGNLNLPKTSGNGIKIDGAASTFGWRDLLGQIITKGVGASDPDWAAYRGTLSQYRFSDGHVHEAWVNFHIPHDYVPGTDLHVHVHWSQIVVDTGGPAGVPGNVKWYFDFSYADGHGTAGGAADPFIAALTQSVVQQGSTTQFGHMIAEVAVSNDGGDATHLDRAVFEPDGVIQLRIYRDNGDAADTLDVEPFVHFTDIHYQSTNIGTKQKAPDFYT